MAAITAAPLGYLIVDGYQAADEFKTKMNICEENLNATSAALQADAENPLTVNLGADNGVQHTTVEFSSIFDLAELEARQKECGGSASGSDLSVLLEQFKDVTGQRYTFSYQSVSHDYVVFPNLPGYESLTSFEQDFEVCAADGKYYPIRMNKNWLVFGDSWGGGAAVTEEDQKEAEQLAKLQAQLREEGAIELN